MRTRTMTTSNATAAPGGTRRAPLALRLGVVTALAVGALSPLLAAGAAHAAAPAEPSGLAIALPPAQQSGDVSWVSGGIAEQADAFKANASRYPLTIELVERQGKSGRGMYTADAAVRIVDARDGKSVVLDAKAEGPYMLVQLPDGRYRIEATLNGHTVKAGPIDVAAGRPTRAAMVFPASEP